MTRRTNHHRRQCLWLNKPERRNPQRFILCARAKPCVWTTRMLTALITGAEGEEMVQTV